MNIIKKVSQYYSEKIKQFGNNSRGVDWNSKESQFIRFEQLCKIIPKNTTKFSILDYGCGYGALVEYLNQNFFDYSYTGFDISEEMIRQANSIRISPIEKINFTTQKEKLTAHDYVIASGIFNVKLDTSISEWEQYIITTLHELNQLSLKGFSFNILTTYSDKEYMKDYLYYADPCFYFNFCKKNFSKNVALLHDYDLYEFTILIKK